MKLPKTVNQLIKFLTLHLKVDINYFLRNGTWLYLSYFISLITGIILTFIYSNYLSHETFGKLNFILSFFSIIGIFSLPGMGQALTHAISNNFEGNFIKAIKQTFLFSLIGSLCLLIAIFYYLNKDLDITYSLILLLIIFPIISFSTYYQCFLSAKKDFKTIAKANIWGFVLGAFTTTLAILAKSPLAIIIASSLLPPLSINTYQTILILKKKLNKKEDRAFLKLGWHLSAAQSIHYLTTNIDKLILGVMLPFNALGIYSFALIIPDQANNLVKQIVPLVMPKISEITEKDIKQSLIQKFVHAVTGVTILVFLYILIAPFVFTKFFPLYSSSILLTQIYALSLIYLPTNLLNLILQRYKQNHFFYLQEVFYFIILVTSMWILIHSYGIIGAVLAQVIAKLLYAFITIIYFSYFSQKL